MTAIVPPAAQVATTTPATAYRGRRARNRSVTVTAYNPVTAWF